MFSPFSINFESPTQWHGDLPVTSRYTAGIALERFFIALRDEGKILGIRCSRCSKTYVPPTLFCPQCLTELQEFVDVGLHGEIYTYTISYRNLDGSLSNAPQVIAFIKIADGGIIHKIEGIPPHQVFIGMKVAAVLKPTAERSGSILDICAFKPFG
ncbi:MAG: DNA-binding protein [Anaerolineae bacterium]|jgi:uncharacterized OB-fold protein|nr:MAG: DNA-binding protein [Anaerolineae bacterium]